jgi:hypothetical protein
MLKNPTITKEIFREQNLEGIFSQVSSATVLDVFAWNLPEISAGPIRIE